MPREPRFSERIRAVGAPLVQLESVNDQLKNAIWNLFETLIGEDFSYQQTAARYVAQHFYKRSLRDFDERKPKGWVYAYYTLLPWHGVYDFLEFLVKHAMLLAGPRVNPLGMRERANGVLEEENSGYRFIDDALAPIATVDEVAEVESAIQASQRSGFVGVHTHLTTAVSLLGRRPTPEIRKAVEEAVLAVEAVAKLVTGVERGGLDAALEELTARLKLRPALKAAIGNLYGDASGKLGVRHAMLQESGVDLPEARFFVIACSAFVNLVISKSGTAPTGDTN